VRVLVVEDDATIASEAAAAIAQAGFETLIEPDGERAWTIGSTNEFGAIILDLGLPRLDGLTILKRWRQAGLWTPVCILTARGSWMERVIGMDAGADDYLSKPFHMEELIARLRALVRRRGADPTAVFTCGDLVIDVRQMRVQNGNRSISLTSQEFKTLNYMLAHRGSVVPAADLIDNVRGEGASITTNAMEALIGRIRRKLGSHIIQTRRGFGYIIPDETV